MPPSGVISISSISRKQALDLVFSQIRDTTVSSNPFRSFHILFEEILSRIDDQSASATGFSNK